MNTDFLHGFAQIIRISVCIRISYPCVSVFLSFFRGFLGLYAAVLPENSAGSKLSQFVSHHILHDKYRDVPSSVVHGNSQTHKIRTYGRASGPGLNRQTRTAEPYFFYFL